MDERDLLREQVEYYQARATEYDEWFLREGRYDLGPEHRARWCHEVAIVEAALEKALPSGEVLELACGTGLWTQHLVKQHSRVVAIDVSSEAIAINRERVGSDAVEYIVADLFNWDTARRSIRCDLLWLLVVSRSARPLRCLLGDRADGAQAGRPRVFRR